LSDFIKSSLLERQAAFFVFSTAICEYKLVEKWQEKRQKVKRHNRSQLNRASKK